MKKCLSLCLAVIMILGAISTVMAESTADELHLILSQATDEELEQAAQLIEAEQRARIKTKIVLDAEELTLSKGSSKRLSAEVTDLADGVKKTKFKWETQDKTVANYVEGSVKAIGPGTTTILCSMTLSDGTELSAQCTVNVYVPVSGLNTASKKISLGVDETQTLDITVKPDNASQKDLSYVSSDESVVRVDENGNITGVGMGKAEVTATSVDGSNKSIVFTVTVTKKDDIGVTKVTNDGVAITLVSVKTSKGASYYKPESGNIFVIPTFELVNNSDDSISISSLLCFDAYCDGYSIDYSFSAACAGGNSMDGEVPVGKKMKGTYGVEVPTNWKELEVWISPSWLGESLTFTIYNQQ